MLAVTLVAAHGYRRAVSDDPGVSVDLSGGVPATTLDLTSGRPMAMRTVTLYR